MASGYTRQSSAEIINGQVINDTDFNNEFDAILGAFNGTTGHDHSGGLGLGPTINLTATSPGVSGILDAKFGGIHTAAADPTATDDTPDYVVGSVWVNTSSLAAFICIDNTSTAARWVRLPAGTITGATTIPTVNEDVLSGYRVGSIIVNTTQATAYVCTSATSGAAVWYPISKGRTYSAASAPGATDDSTKGYAAGSVGVDTATSTIYICSDASAAAAVWGNVTFNSGYVAMIAQVFG